MSSLKSAAHSMGLHSRNETLVNKSSFQASPDGTGLLGEETVAFAGQESSAETIDSKEERAFVRLGHSWM